jgi:Rha family phage regulatory protein
MYDQNLNANSAQVKLSTPSVSLVNGRPATTSLQIAEHFGKRHAHVIRDIQKITKECPLDFTEPNFGLSEYTDESGRTLPMFTVYRDGFMLLVMGYTGPKALQIKLAYIQAFNAMAEELARHANAAPSLPEPPEILTPSTVEDRKPLRGLIEAWHKVSGQDRDVLWRQAKAAFGISNVKELPAEWVPDMSAWIQERLDTLQNTYLTMLPAMAVMHNLMTQGNLLSMPMGGQRHE